MKVKVKVKTNTLAHGPALPRADLPLFGAAMVASPHGAGSFPTN